MKLQICNKPAEAFRLINAQATANRLARRNFDRTMAMLDSLEALGKRHLLPGVVDCVVEIRHSIIVSARA